MHQERRRANGRFAWMALGGALAAAGFVAGGGAPWEREATAQPQSTGIAFKGDLPGLVIPTGGTALVASGGVYFLVDQTGMANPVRYRDANLRVSPGESLLRRD